MASLENHVALVTGATAGIGRALALELAARGADLVLVGRRADRLETVAAEVVARGRRALAVAGDVTRDGDLETAVQRAMDTFGHLDVVVANAGFGVVGTVDRLGLDDYRRQFETNVYGVLRTVKAALPALKASRGRLALVGSVNGYVSLPGNSPYAMSKFAVRALAFSLRHELLGEGVSVTHVAPGFVISEIRLVDNRGRYHAGARDRVPAWLQMPASTAARQIVRAISRRRAEVVVTGHGKLAVWVQRHLPWLLDLGLRVGKLRARPEP